MAQYKKDYVRIENLSQYILPSIEQYHPDDPRHTSYWKNLKRMCIEGLWGTESKGYRYCPGRLFFYGNFCTILDFDQEEKTREKIKPEIRDIEWERAYMILEAEGFSGWSEDDEYTSDELWFKYNEEGLPNIKDISPKKLKRFLQLINKEGRLKKYIKPRENIRKLHPKNMGLPLYWNTSKNVFELGSRGGGKQLMLDEVVLSKNGWVKMKDISTGDLVFGSDGKLCKVTNKSDEEEYPYYKITLRDGREIEACENHLWKVWSRNENKNSKKDVYVEMSTKEMFESYFTRRVDSKHKKKYGEIKYLNEYKYALPVCKEVQFDEKELPVDPYILGLFLGDGHMGNTSLETCDQKITESVIKYCDDNNYTYRIKDKDCSKSHTIFITNKNREKKSLKKLFKELKLLDKKSCTKFIPEEYKYASIEQRYELLRGLMDTDGFADKTHIEYYTVSKTLSKDFQDLVRSLGINCRTAIKKTFYKDKNNNKKQGKDCYRTSIYTDKKVFNLNRKQNKIDKHIKSKSGRSKYNKTYIVNIEPVGNRLGACISVDSYDNTYITKDYIVTHNSYFWSLAVCKHEICFDGSKYYTEDNIKNPKKSEVCVGAGQQGKSSEFIKKIYDSLNELAVRNDLGAWGRPGDDDYEPNVFYKEMAGTIKPNNKDNLWRHEYKVIEKGGETVEGTGSYVAHVVYSIQKRDGAESAAGGRYNKLIYEEAGLNELLTKAWGSNNSTVAVEGIQIGNQIALGTSGNMETIMPAKEVFTHPEQYNVVSYNDDWEESGLIGFFLPVYMTDRDFKDKDGNTDYEGAIDKYLQKRLVAQKADNPHVLAMEKMNSPLVPSDMWQTNKGNILPVNEAELREKELRHNRLYEKIGTPVELIWDSSKDTGVRYTVKHDAHPFYEPKFRYERESLDGCVMIYDFPRKHPDLGYKIPDDMYKFIGHDPYVSDNIDEGDSLGVSYVVMNPKYITDGFPGNTIVASYIGKPVGGRKEYYSNLEKLMAFYGNPTRGLWFEANRGDECKNYFMNRNKNHLLALRPQRMYSSNVYATKITQYGFTVGNKVVKVDLLDKFSDWLLEETNLSDGKKRNIERIPCMFLIKQIQQFSLESGNYDAVSAMLGCILGLREEEYRITEEIQNKHSKRNNISFLSTNTKLFRPVSDVDRMRTINKKFYGKDVPYLPK